MSAESGGADLRHQSAAGEDPLRGEDREAGDGPMSEEQDKQDKPEAAESSDAAKPPAPAVDPEREAKLKAAAEARAARAAAKEKADAEAAEAAPAEPKPPSPKQPHLDLLVALVKQETEDEEAIVESYLNELNGDMPTLVIHNKHWRSIASMLKGHDELRFNYLRNVSGVDYETHMEVVYHMIGLDSKLEAAIKVRTDRDAASVQSATPVWATANWNEREIYDLLGIDFPGHPDLRRIMMPDDWVGHPLRKDYEPLDSEV
ncbi:NADH-quinone oxidoreductase subunit C [Paenibacillus sp. 2TAB19]|uniref:NADH-quinone oxidoreductase subunit C n=1 Tax=Paenibacillus sp. 2TAB19 TaxID=3233003 RepID=UPI003F9CADED